MGNACGARLYVRSQGQNLPVYLSQRDREEVEFELYQYYVSNVDSLIDMWPSLKENFPRLESKEEWKARQVCAPFC